MDLTFHGNYRVPRTLRLARRKLCAAITDGVKVNAKDAVVQGTLLVSAGIAPKSALPSEPAEKRKVQQRKKSAMDGRGAHLSMHSLA